MLTIKRIAAYLIDWAVIFVGLALGLNALISLISGPPDVDFLSENPLLLWGRVLATVSVPSWIYFILSDSHFGGQTVGKRVLGLHTVNPDDSTIEVRQAVGRNALKLVPWEIAHIGNLALLGQPPAVQYSVLGIGNLLALAYIVVLIRNGGRRTVHDLAAGTEVTPK